jgi:Cellulose binding domain
MQRVCVAPTCTDLVKNGDETAVDCGGSCAPCAKGPDCTVGKDCASGVCRDGACAPARCDDGIKNGSESDVDCGRGCTPCELERPCVDGDDCASGACDGRCLSTVRVELQAGNRDASPVCIQPCFNLVNEGDGEVALSELSIRYFYTNESQGAESFGCYWVSHGDCNQVAPPVFAGMSPQRPGADRYVELSFTSAALPLMPGGSFVLQDGFCLTNGQRFTQADDYSYNASATYQTSHRVALYRDGVRIWGDEP